LGNYPYRLVLTPSLVLAQQWHKKRGILSSQLNVLRTLFSWWARHNTRNLRIWLPLRFDAARKYPTLYILDGASAFTAHSFWWCSAPPSIRAILLDSDLEMG